MEASAPNLVGREEELAALLQLVDAPDALPLVAVVAGEAGIGKTALWLAGVELAAARGFRVLSSRPSEAEAGLSFLALTDILGGVANDVLPGLPPIQRRALEGALLLGEPELRAAPRAVAAAFLGALRLLADVQPICLAVDDVQWLDAASVSALRFALARLDHERVATVLAVRDDTPEWLRRAVDADRRRMVRVRGLSLGATHELLRNRLGATFARPVLIKLWETSGGNPLFALELAAALRRRGGTLSAGEDLPIPTVLDELLNVRVDALGADVFDAAGVVAALAEPTVSLVEEGRRRSGTGGGPCDRHPRGRRGAPQIHASAARVRGRRAPDAVAPTITPCAARRDRPDARGTSAPPRARDR